MYNIFAFECPSSICPSDLLTWAHHSDLKTVPDEMLLKAIEAAEGDAADALSSDTHEAPTKIPSHFQPVSFAMSCKVEFTKESEEVGVLSEVQTRQRCFELAAAVYF